MKLRIEKTEKRELWAIIFDEMEQDESLRDCICSGIIDRDFAQLIYYYWPYVLARCRELLRQDQEKVFPRWRISSVDDCYLCLEQMLAPYEIEAARLKQSLSTKREHDLMSRIKSLANKFISPLFKKKNL